MKMSAEKRDGYALLRSNRKTLQLEIQEDGTLLVRAPMRISDRMIRAFIREKQYWITRHQYRVRVRSREQQQKTFITGERFLFLGNDYPLIVTPKQADISLTLLQDTFFLSSCSAQEARNAFKAWYARYGLPVLQDLVRVHAERVGIEPRSVRVSKAERQWGSCGVRGDLRFSWRIIMAPLSVIESVVAHEVAHLLERNHSRAFYDILLRLYPSYRIHNRWLKDHEHKLIL